MIIELSVPQPGEAVHEVVIARWLKSNGDIVEKDEVLAEIDTDKVSMTLHAQESGVLEILVPVGPIGTGVTVAKINTDIPSHVVKSIVNIDQLIDTKLNQIEEFNNIFDKTVKQVNVGNEDYLFFMKKYDKDSDEFLADISFVKAGLTMFFSYQKVWSVFREKYNMSDADIKSFLEMQIFLKYGFAVSAY